MFMEERGILSIFSIFVILDEQKKIEKERYGTYVIMKNQLKRRARTQSILESRHLLV